MTEPARILLLGSIPRVMLAVARSLGRDGHRVDAALESPRPLATCSRYILQAHDLPAYADSAQAWLDGLSQLLAQERYDLVIPCGDWESLLCHSHRDQLGPLARLALPDADALEQLMDKATSGALARSLDVPTPREALVRASDLAPPEALSFPLVLKRRRSFELDNPGQWQRTVKVAGAADYASAMGRLCGTGDVLAQEMVPGGGVGIELLTRAGLPLLAFQHTRIHEPLAGGPSSYRMSTALTPHLYRAAVRILASLNYTGVAMVEFIVDPPSGRWNFLEVNPRFWGSLPLALAAGANFPLGLVRVMLDQPVGFGPRYRHGLYCRNWTLDLDWMRNDLRHDPRRTWPTVAWQLTTNVAALRERSDTFSLDDPAPALFEAKQLLEQLSKRK